MKYSTWSFIFCKMKKSNSVWVLHWMKHVFVKVAVVGWWHCHFECAYQCKCEYFIIKTFHSNVTRWIGKHSLFLLLHYVVLGWVRWQRFICHFITLRKYFLRKVKLLMVSFYWHLHISKVIWDFFLFLTMIYKDLHLLVVIRWFGKAQQLYLTIIYNNVIHISWNYFSQRE